MKNVQPLPKGKSLHVVWVLSTIDLMPHISMKAEAIEGFRGIAWFV